MSPCAVTVVLLRRKPRQWLASEEVDLLLPGPEAMAAARGRRRITNRVGAELYDSGVSDEYVSFTL
jgi:hypothetical protein